MSKEKVELHQAFFWICPECGNDNYDRSINMEGKLPEALEGAIRERLGIPEWEEFSVDKIENINVMMLPVVVICKSCKSKVETIKPGF